MIEIVVFPDEKIGFWLKSLYCLRKNLVFNWNRCISLRKFWFLIEIVVFSNENSGFFFIEFVVFPDEFFVFWLKSLYFLRKKIGFWLKSLYFLGKMLVFDWNRFISYMKFEFYIKLLYGELATETSSLRAGHGDCESPSSPRRLRDESWPRRLRVFELATETALEVGSEGWGGLQDVLKLFVFVGGGGACSPFVLQ